MDQAQLDEIVNQDITTPGVLGGLACNLRVNDLVAQRHHDGREFDVFWNNNGNCWRCTVWLNKTTDRFLIQVELFNDGVIRIQSTEPCSVTIDPDLDILKLVRFKI